jgi:hypothetical protein
VPFYLQRTALSYASYGLLTAYLKKTLAKQFRQDWSEILKAAKSRLSDEN